jgi:uncharacterized protein (TIRG00374 family)
MPGLSRRLLRRGLEIFAVISIIGFGALLFYGNNFGQFIGAMASLRWEWVLVGVALASLDWFGGGLRLYVLARHVFPNVSLKGSILAGGLNTWASYLTPAQTGGGPMMVYVMKRYGTPLPEAMISSLMTFVATVLFFAIVGPLTVFFGAGRSLEQHGVLGKTLTLLDLYRLSLGAFIAIGVAVLLLIMFPGIAHALARRVGSIVTKRGSPGAAERVRSWHDGIDRSHECLVAFFKGRGWAALAGGVLLSAPSHANKMMAGWVVLRMLDIHAHFIDVLLLQTLITFILYFAPTPGGSGLAELLSAAVMSIYVPRELTPSYILLWRIVVCYLTVGFGSVVFWRWLKLADARGDAKDENELAAT